MLIVIRFCHMKAKRKKKKKIIDNRLTIAQHKLTHIYKTGKQNKSDSHL